MLNKFNNKMFNKSIIININKLKYKKNKLLKWINCSIYIKIEFKRFKLMKIRFSKGLSLNNNINKKFNNYK